MTVAELMRQDVQVVQPDTPVADVLRLWQEGGDRGVVVVEAQAVVGIVTEGDLVARRTPLKPVRYFTILDAIIPFGEVGATGLKDLKRHIGTSAGDLMSHPVVTIRSDADVAEAAEIFVERRIRHLPVTDERGRLVGMLYRSDLLSHAFEGLF